MFRLTFATLAALTTLLLAALPAAYAQDDATPETTSEAVTSGYAAVNGLDMYYEIHGSGEPLVVLHGAYMSVDTMADFIRPLAASRQVIGVELQGHGRTADIDRPLRYDLLAGDVVALLDQLGVQQADVFGYSFGGGVALQLAISYPERVDRLAVASMLFDSAGYHPGMMEMFETITPEMFAGSPMETEYLRLAPNPDGFATLVQKLAELDSQPLDWSPESIQSITAPTLLIFGDADVITLDHAIEMFGLRGGGVNGDIVGLPDAQLAILPGTSHIGIIFRANLLVPMLTGFFDETPVMPAF